MIRYFQCISLLSIIFLIVGCENIKKEHPQIKSSNSIENNAEKNHEEHPGKFGELLKIRRTASDETEPSYPLQNLLHEFKKTKQAANLRNAHTSLSPRKQAKSADFEPKTMEI